MHRRQAPKRLPIDSPPRQSFTLPNVPRSVAMLLFWLVLAIGAARSEFTDDFEGATPSWTVAGGDCRIKVEIHRRTARHAIRGNRCEHLRIVADSGTYVYATHDIEPAMVIDELAPSVWVKSDRSGLQLLARVVLPRSKNLRGGGPVTTLIRGTSYDQVGSWQRLRIDRPHTLLDHRVPVIRAQLGPQIDPREAYIDLLVLNVYGGLGTTNVWIDDMTVDNHVPRSGGGDGRSNLAGPRNGWSPTDSKLGTDRSRRSGASPVSLSRSTLMVDGKPFFPRAIEHRGEPLAWLAKLGFNTIWLATPPTPAQVEEAQELGLWFVAPPPLAPSGPNGHATAGQVLAWDLGRELSTRQLAAVQGTSALLQRDPERYRPLICGANSGLYAYSRHADILLHTRLPIGTSFELTDFSAWLAQRAQLARPGTPTWVTVQTEPHGDVVELLTGRDRHGTVPFVEPEQMRQLALLAVASGARGLLFQSRTALDQRSVESRIRALTFQRLNHELSLIEPWIAGGSSRGRVESNDPEIVAFTLATDRSRLVIPIPVSSGDQYVSKPANDDPFALTIPDVPESSRAFELSATRLNPLRNRRVAGGMRVLLDNLTPRTLIVLTKDVLVIQSLSRRIQSAVPAQTQLQCHLAAELLAAVGRTEQRLETVAPAQPRGKMLLGEAQANLRSGERFLAAGDHTTAEHYGRLCLAALRQLRRLRWEQAIQSGLPSPVTSPFCVSFATLPEHWQLVPDTRPSAARTDVLPSGHFESLEQLQQTGWRHFEHTPATLRTDVSLSSHNPKEGKYALRIRAERRPDDANATVVETTPVWVNSAPIPIAPGQLVRIGGWVRVDKPITGSLDGLMVFDSLGGPMLGQRIRKTQGWQEVALLRWATRPTQLVVTIVLTGVGDVEVDDFSVQLMGGAGYDPTELGRPSRVMTRRRPTANGPPASRSAAVAKPAE